MRFRGLSFLVASAIVAAGCGSNITAPSSAPYSQTELHIGSGTEATAGAVVTVNYTGWLYDRSKTDGKGIQFDSSANSSTPFSFTLGQGQVIAGWDQGVPGMKVGGIRRLVIPPSLAYGAARYGPIPPDATLVFDIELVDVTTSSVP
jgi:FKBP-type peptidyl-prolyl cis-trans isomerase FkpA